MHVLHFITVSERKVLTYASHQAPPSLWHWDWGFCHCRAQHRLLLPPADA